jgi:hypothetical protein
MVIVSSPLGFSGSTIRFDEIPFPVIDGMTSYVGHPSTRQLLEKLGACTDASGANGNVGKWQGPNVGEQYLAVPLVNNVRPDGVTVEQAVTDVSKIKAILCTRIA